MIRGDSGFATPELYRLCDEQQVNFVVKLKANQRLKRIARELASVLEAEGDFESDGTARTRYYELDYQPSTWERHYRVVLKLSKTPEELFFSRTFLVTNFLALKSEDLFKIYDKRGIAENYIKEAKLGFFIDKTESHYYLINAVHMLINAIAYSIVQSLKWLALSTGEAKDSIATLRFKLFHLPAKIIHHARQTTIQLSRSNVFDRLFWQVLHRIQSL